MHRRLVIVLALLSGNCLFNGVKTLTVISSHIDLCPLQDVITSDPAWRVLLQRLVQPSGQYTEEDIDRLFSVFSRVTRSQSVPDFIVIGKQAPKLQIFSTLYSRS